MTAIKYVFEIIAKMAMDLQVQACDIPEEVMFPNDRTAMNIQPKWQRTVKFRRATSPMT